MRKSDIATEKIKAETTKDLRIFIAFVLPILLLIISISLAVYIMFKY